MIAEALRAELAELKVSEIAEYLYDRLQLEEGASHDGTVTLKIVFKNGRYDRLKRLAAP